MQDVCTDAEMTALLNEAKRGNAAAYDRLYNLYADKIYRYLYARLGQRETAEDLAADVFVRLVQVLPRYRVNPARPVASFSAWLYRIAANLLTDHHRKQRHRNHFNIEDRVDLASDLPAPQQHAERSENGRFIASAISQLGGEQQAVLIFRFGDQLSVQEVAERMGKTIGAVKALQHRALANLRVILTGREF